MSSIYCKWSNYYDSLLMLTNREKEEDLEKRQFFINRELRPLNAIPGLYFSLIIRNVTH